MDSSARRLKYYRVLSASIEAHAMCANVRPFDQKCRHCKERGRAPTALPLATAHRGALQT